LIPVRGKKLALKVDMLVEGTDVPTGMDYRQASRKAAAMCVSDFAAKGVRPDSFMVSLGLRRGTTSFQVSQLGKGLRDAEREWGIHLVGGDTNEASELVIDCAMVGFAEKFVGRGGARAGDVLVVTGYFGYPPAGLRILGRGAAAEKRFRENAVRSVREPKPNLEVGLALANFLNSGMDSSDGLARSIHTLAKASRVGFEVDSLPTGAGVARFAKANKLSVEDLVLAGGEEYLIVGTVAKKKFPAAKRVAERNGGHLIAIGRAVPQKRGVLLRLKGSSKPLEDIGWTHLS
jgi:thiamine-monophosphate kinase